MDMKDDGYTTAGELIGVRYLPNHKILYVGNLPGDGGKDWGYVTERNKAIPLNKYWQRRFTANMGRVGGDGRLQEIMKSNPDIHIDVNSHNQREAGAYMKNPAPKSRRKAAVYWAITLHDGYLSFRTDSGYTGSTPYDQLPGKTPVNKAHTYADSLGLTRTEYEIIDDRTPGAYKKNPKALHIKKRSAEPRGKIWVRSNKNVRRMVHEQTAKMKDSKFAYSVQVLRNGSWVTLGKFNIKATAIIYGKSLAAHYKSKTFRVMSD